MRLKILACWPYSRPGWVAPLERLHDRGHRVAYLAYRTPADEPADHALPRDRERLYWQQFREAGDILRLRQPDRIVLMGTEGAWNIALIAAARAAGVPTAVLQHGVFGPVDAYPTDAGQLPPRPPARTRGPALSFLARSLRHDPIELLRSVRYLVAAARTTPWRAAPLHPLASRRADAYLTASPRASQFHRTMDHVPPERIHPVGLPEYDSLLGGSLSAGVPNTALLIDTPHTGGPHGLGSTSGDEKSAHLVRIGRALAAAGWRLTVKLHPDSFGDAWARRLDVDGVTVVRDAAILDLLAAHEVVLGFDSTALVAALHHRPGLLMQTRGGTTWLSDLAAGLGAIPPAPDLETVTVADVVRAREAAGRTAAGRRRLVTEILGPPDGRALERVEQVLLSLRPDPR